MSVERGINLQMVLRIKMHRNAGEASAAQKLSESLSRRRRWPLGIHINHLPRAIDDHSELRHLMRAEQAVEMRPANQIDFALVGNPHRNVCESAITHRQSREFANAGMLGNPRHPSDVRLSLLDSKTQIAGTCTVDQRE